LVSSHAFDGQIGKIFPQIYDTLLQHFFDVFSNINPLFLYIKWY